MNMNSYEMVRNFQTAMGQPVAEQPTMMDRGGEHDQLALRMAARRLENVMNDMKVVSYGGRIMKRASWLLEELIEFMRAESLTDQVDALTDIDYINRGTWVEIGVQPDPCFAIVHYKNMDKLGPYGKPIIDAQGKVRKREGWTGPEEELTAEIERQRR
jgi:predicted HAD superfamily Cof-like phosphohydrolase